MGLPLMSRYSSGSTLGPLSIARPDPSKIRPSMSSDTPSFKLWPVNSTLVCSGISHPNPPYMVLSTYLLHIDAGGAFENLDVSLIGVAQLWLDDAYLDDSSVTWSMGQQWFGLRRAMLSDNDLPRASRTWPDRSVPSGRVSVTISLYLGNLT